MKRLLIAGITTTIILLGAAGCTSGSSASSAVPQSKASNVAAKSSSTAPKKTMQAFRSVWELKAYFRQIAEKQKREARRASSGIAAYDAAPQPAAPAPSTALASTGVIGELKADKAEESVTNVQHAGVDEGGIVKVHGDHLVVLRRGRLFTVAIGDGALTPHLKPGCIWAGHRSTEHMVRRDAGF